MPSSEPRVVGVNLPDGYTLTEDKNGHWFRAFVKSPKGRVVGFSASIVSAQAALDGLAAAQSRRKTRKPATGPLLGSFGGRSG